jgi:glycosyltransferase involved in cell wall biosynthesis
MKIAILTSSFPRYPGDFQGNFIYYLARGQVKSGTSVSIICPHISGTPFQEIMDDIEVYRFAYFYPYRFQRMSSDTGMYSALRYSLLSWIQLPLFFLCMGFTARRLIRRQGVDILHTHWLVPQGLAGAFLHRLTGILHIASIHGTDLNILKKYTVLHPVCRFITRHSAVITVNSSYMKRQLLAVSPDCEMKIRIVPMGIDPEQFGIAPVADMKQRYGAGHLIMSVGRLIDWKGTEFLIRAIPAVLEKFPDAKLLIVGAGPERDVLVRQVRELGLENRVIFLGFISKTDLIAYYHSADVFVLPSINRAGKTEGLGVVLLEAMASGCPVIGSNVGGIPDIIVDGENGFLVPEQDPAALAEKIIQILSNDDLTDQFRKSGYETVQTRFTWEIISKKFSEVYCTVLEGDGKKTSGLR